MCTARDAVVWGNDNIYEHYAILLNYDVVDHEYVDEHLCVWELIVEAHVTLTNNCIGDLIVCFEIIGVRRRVQI